MASAPPPPTTPLAAIGGCDVGYGAMRLSTAGRPERHDAVAALREVVASGVRLVDTADAYCLDDSDVGHNESLIAEALAGSAGADVVVATKGGHRRDRSGGWYTDGRPEHLVAACEASLRRLGREAIDLYFFHRPDPAVPFEESVGALRTLLDAGKVRMVGLSNVDVAQLAAAAQIVPVAAVQNELSPDTLASLPVAATCRAQGVDFLPWGPLGGSAASTLGERHPALDRIGARHGCSPQRAAIAWLRTLAPGCIPIPGGRGAARVLDSVAGASLVLGPEDQDDVATLVREAPR